MIAPARRGRRGPVARPPITLLIPLPPPDPEGRDLWRLEVARVARDMAGVPGFVSLNLELGHAGSRRREDASSIASHVVDALEFAGMVEGASSVSRLAIAWTSDVPSGMARIEVRGSIPPTAARPATIRTHQTRAERAAKEHAR